MTDREKLIELLLEIDSVCDASDCCECCEEGCYTYRAADHLIANGVTFATDTNDGGKWISVEDRLPELDESPVLGWFGGEIGFANFAEQSGTDAEGNVWTRKGFEQITHWMPLPDPPKED
jgi:hypothetical protein